MGFALFTPCATFYAYDLLMVSLRKYGVKRKIKTHIAVFET
jgi:hypothetical protein